MWEQWSVHCTVKNQIYKTHLIILQSKLREYKDIQVEIVSIFVFREREREEVAAFSLQSEVWSKVAE